MRHEEGADHKQGSNERRKTGSQAVFRTDEYPTPGWIQPRDKPVSGFTVWVRMVRIRVSHRVRHNLSARPSGVWCGPSSSSDTRRVDVRI